MIKPIRALSLLTLGLSVLLFSGCFDDGVQEWDRQMLAFDAGTDTSPSHTFTLDADQEEPVVEEVTVELAGPHQQNDVQAVFEINGQLTSALEGEHFEVLNDNNVAVIPAGTSFGDIEFRVLAESLDPAESVDIAPRLTDESDWDIMENFRQYVLTVEKAEVEFGADIAGTDAFEDVEGEVHIQGDTPGESFAAEIDLEGLEEESTYTWAVYRGTVDSPGNVVGDAAAYADIITDEEEDSASAEAELDILLSPHDELHVQVHNNGDLVAAQDLELLR